MLFFLVFFLAFSAQAESNRDEFFNSYKLYYVRIRGWNPEFLGPDALKKAKEVPGSIVEIFTANPESDQHCPDSESRDGNRLYSSADFALGMKGNATFGTPKASYKVKLKKSHFLGMPTLVLNSMWNDISQMREALAWKVFQGMGLKVSGHTYAKFCIDGRYKGLYSVIEDIDRAYVDRRFPQNPEGNLYKANVANEDIGGADLNLRADGVYFRQQDPDERTYEIKPHDKHKKNKAYTNYSDLKKFIEVLHRHDPRSNAFSEAMEKVMEVNDFLKWLAANVLIGGWDNYWKNPTNYVLYNFGSMDNPYFKWLPWDYDNSFGVTYDGSEVQNADLLHFTNFPLAKKLLENPKYRSWYLSHVDFALNHMIHENWINQEIDRIWPVIAKAAFLESDSAHGFTHTGRQYTNDQVYWNGRQHHFFERSGMKIYGILHYVRMRHESARRQLNSLRN